MDFPLISARIAALAYSRVDEFVRDVRLVFENCIAFWGPRMPYSIRARYLLDEVDLRVKEMKFALATGVQAESIGGGKKGGKGTGHSKGSGALAALKPWAAPALHHLVAVGSGGASVKGEAKAETPATPNTPGTPLAFPSSSVGGGVGGAESSERAVMSPAEYAKCSAIISQLKATPTYHLFVLPPDIPSIPLFEYYARIPRCMDLTTISRRLKILDFSTSEEFIADVSLIWRNVAVYYDDTGEAASFGGEAEEIRQMAKQLEADFTRRWDKYDSNKASGRGGGGQTAAAAAAPSATPFVSPDRSPPPSPSPASLAVSSARSSPSSSTLIVIKKAPAAVQLPTDGRQQRDAGESSKAEWSGLQVRVKKEEPSDQPQHGAESASIGLGGSHPDIGRSLSPSPLHSASTTSTQPGEGASDAVKMEVDAKGARRIPKKDEPHPSHPSLQPPSSDSAALPFAASQLRARGPSPIPPSASLATAPSITAPTAAGHKTSTTTYAARGGGAQSTSTSLARLGTGSAPSATASSSSSLPLILPAPPKVHKAKIVVKPLTPAQRRELLEEASSKLTALHHRTIRKPSQATHHPTQPTRQHSPHQHTSAPLSPLLPHSLMPKDFPALHLPPSALPPLPSPFVTAASLSTSLSRSRGVQLSVSVPCGPSPSAYVQCGFVQSPASSVWLRGSHSFLPATTFFPYHIDSFTIDLAWDDSERLHSISPFFVLCSSSERLGEYVDDLMPATAAALDVAATRLIGWKRSRMEMEAQKGGRTLERSLRVAEKVAAIEAGEGAPAASTSSVWPHLHCRPVEQLDVAHLRLLPGRLRDVQRLLEKRERDSDGRRSLAEPNGAGWQDSEAQRSTLQHYADLIHEHSEEDATSTTRWEQPALWWSQHARCEVDTSTTSESSPAEETDHLHLAMEDAAAPREADVDAASTLSISSSALPRRRRRFHLRSSTSLFATGASSASQRLLVPFVRVRLFGFAGLWKVGLQWKSTVDALAPSPLHPARLWTTSTLVAYEQQQLRKAELEQQRRTEENERRIVEEYRELEGQPLLASVLHPSALHTALTLALSPDGSLQAMDES